MSLSMPPPTETLRTVTSNVCFLIPCVSLQEPPYMEYIVGKNHQTERIELSKPCTSQYAFQCIHTSSGIDVWNSKQDCTTGNHNLFCRNACDQSYRNLPKSQSYWCKNGTSPCPKIALKLSDISVVYPCGPKFKIIHIRIDAIKIVVPAFVR